MRHHSVVGLVFLFAGLTFLAAAVLTRGKASVSAGQSNNTFIASLSPAQVNASGISSGISTWPYRPLISAPLGAHISVGSIGVAGIPATLSGSVLPCVAIPGVIDKCPTWISTYDGPAHGFDGQYSYSKLGRSTVTSPDGRVVYLMATTTVGTKASGAPQYDEIVIAFDSATGQQLWASIFGGTTDLPNPIPAALAVSSDGSRLFTTNHLVSDDGATTASATVGFDANTGAQLWSATVPLASGSDIAISPAGDRVYIAGSIPGKNPDGTQFVHALTISYDAVSGQQLWRSEYAASSPNQALGIRTAVKPDGSVLYVAGSEAVPGQSPFEVTLVVYDTQTGALLHEAHHPASVNPPSGIALSDSRIFVAANVNLTNPGGIPVQNALTIGLRRPNHGQSRWFTGVCDHAQQ
jgi:outer membrane protein assembly factor BamB